MRIGLPAIDDHDWSSLQHAYGHATDTPGHLRALADGDEAGRKAALDHLFSAVIHQGTPWTATGPTALVVAGLLAHASEATLAIGLLAFLGYVGEAAALIEAPVAELRLAAGRPIAKDVDLEEEMDQEILDIIWARALLGCADAAPVVFDPVVAQLESTHAAVRAQAAAAAMALAAAMGREKELVPALLHAAEVATTTDERSAMVLALGDLGATPAAFLSDPSPAVRLCAAMAPALAKDDTATVDLLGALEKHATEIETWFTEKPPQLVGWVRFAVVARLLDRVAAFEDLVRAAVAVTRVTNKMCVDRDWGPLLARAFPAGDGQVTTPAQRAYLSALVENAALWDTHFGNPGKWFRQAGLPYDRAACAKILAE